MSTFEEIKRQFEELKGRLDELEAKFSLPAYDASQIAQDGILGKSSLSGAVRELLHPSTSYSKKENHLFICASTTRPTNPVKGMLIYETDTDKVYVCTVGGATPIWKLVYPLSVFRLQLIPLGTVSTDFWFGGWYIYLQGSVTDEFAFMGVIPKSWSQGNLTVRLFGYQEDNVGTVRINRYTSTLNEAGVLNQFENPVDGDIITSALGMFVKSWTIAQANVVPGALLRGKISRLGTDAADTAGRTPIFGMTVSLVE